MYPTYTHICTRYRSLELVIHTHTSIQADTATCICHMHCVSVMHSAVSCAYVPAYLYVQFPNTYKIYHFISVLHLHVFWQICTCRITDDI
jgi:hypothetical protein